MTIQTTKPKKRSERGQNAVEFMLILAGVMAALVIFLRPGGFFSRSLNRTIGQSVNYIRRSADCVCYDPVTGEPCAAVCGNGCCEEEERATCPSDCGVAAGYYWVVGGWSGCDAVCGDGIDTRSVTCRDSGGAIVAAALCTSALGTTPEASRPCNNGPCNCQWQTSGWTTCTVECGGGQQFRDVECIRLSNNTTAPNSCCLTEDGPRPADHQACNTHPCCFCSYQIPMGCSALPCCGFGCPDSTYDSRVWTCNIPGCQAPTGSNPQCTEDPACCTPWTNLSCGLPNCPTGQRQQTRDCGVIGTQYQCVVDSSCAYSCATPKLHEQDSWAYQLCQENPSSVNEAWVVRDSCTGSGCEVRCRSPFVRSGSSCVCPSGQIRSGNTCISMIECFYCNGNGCWPFTTPCNTGDNPNLLHTGWLETWDGSTICLTYRTSSTQLCNIYLGPNNNPFYDSGGYRWTRGDLVEDMANAACFYDKSYWICREKL